MNQNNLAITKGLPANIDAEKFVLGSIMLDDIRFADLAGVVRDDDFALDKHRRIYQRMCELRLRGERIDRVTVANELLRRDELESVDGLAYLVSLDDGLPKISNLDSYVRIIREKATLRRLAMASQHMLNRTLIAEEDPSAIIEDFRLTLSTIYDSSAQSEAAETVFDIIRETGGVDKFFTPTYGIKSPWPRVDFFTGGWQDEELILIGARPSMGKTAFVLNMLWHAAHVRRKNAVFYSYEMKKTAITRRLVSLLTGISYQDIQQQNISQDQRSLCRQKLGIITESPIRIVQSSGKSVMALRAHAERLKQRDELDIIGIDYIGLMRSGSNRAGMNRNQELGEIARELKRLAMDLKVPVVCLSQLNRMVATREDKRPGMADLRDSGEIEEHADFIGFLHRPGYYDRESISLQNLAEFIIAKQRNGDTVNVALEFNRINGEFKNEKSEDDYQ
jgi:replicative DNA helicase